MTDEAKAITKVTATSALVVLLVHLLFRSLGAVLGGSAD